MCPDFFAVNIQEFVDWSLKVFVVLSQGVSAHNGGSGFVREGTSRGTQSAVHTQLLEGKGKPYFP